MHALPVVSYRRRAVGHARGLELERAGIGRLVSEERGILEDRGAAMRHGLTLGAKVLDEALGEAIG
jgi:hypothetical protein